MGLRTWTSRSTPHFTDVSVDGLTILSLDEIKRILLPDETFVVDRVILRFTRPTPGDDQEDQEDQEDYEPQQDREHRDDIAFSEDDDVWICGRRWSCCRLWHDDETIRHCTEPIRNVHRLWGKMRWSCFVAVVVIMLASLFNS